jgi:uncharacterized protein YndB with AHSA1/START domain
MKKWLIRIMVGLVGAVVLAAVVLWLMGLRQDAGVSRASVEINAPREQVWPWVEEGDKNKKWIGWVVDVQPVNSVTGVGQKRVVLMNEPGSPRPVRLEAEFTEYNPPARLSADVTIPGLFTGSQGYELTDLGNGRTRVEIVNRIHYTSWFVRLFEPMATPSATSKIERDLAALKTQVEQAVQGSAKA